MQMQSGSLSAESHGAGEGATFTVEMPTIAGVLRPAPEIKLPEAPAATPQRILLVDDNEDTLRVMARLLRLGGHKVVTADSLNTALNAAAQPFDLLITDIGLPDGTGWELMTQLRQRGPVRGIVISGFSMDEDIRRSETAGFVEHLSKPVNPEDLDRAIRRAAVEQVA
jgi:CheY-like chemotaxis protein